MRVSRRHPRLHTSSDRSQGAARSTSGARYLVRVRVRVRVRLRLRLRLRVRVRLRLKLTARVIAGARYHRDCTYEIAPPEEQRSIVSRERHEPRSMRVTAERASSPSPSGAAPGSDDAACTDEGDRSTTF